MKSKRTPSVELDESLSTEHFQEVGSVPITLDCGLELVWLDLVVEVHLGLLEDESGKELGQVLVELLIRGPCLHILHRLE